MDGPRTVLLVSLRNSVVPHFHISLTFCLVSSDFLCSFSTRSSNADIARCTSGVNLFHSRKSTASAF